VPVRFTRARLCGVSCLAVLVAAASPSAWAQTISDTLRPNAVTQAAYEAAIKCFVANGYGRSIKRDAGDTAAAQRYEDAAAASWQAAHVIAMSWSYPETRLTRDIDRARERELPVLVLDAAYLRSTVATCRGLGLMPAG